MKLIKTISDLKQVPQNCILTIGNFDGVHIGHRAILTTARKIADKRSTDLVAMTFEPHPAAILHPEKAPGILTPRPYKKHLLARLGVDFRLLIETTTEILSLSPVDFVKKFLLEALFPLVVVEGEDFNFGAKRSGNVQILQDLGGELGFEVVIVPSKKIELEQTVRISSTMIRYMIEGGEVSDAALALGRPYKLTGRIIPGRGKGAELGFPTLNMEIPNQLIPAEGVYAGFVTIAENEEKICEFEEKRPAVFSIGQARTFGYEYPLLIEAHILDSIEGDFADKWMAMDFIEFIRHQHKFDAPQALAAEIAKDCKKAKEILT